jgi:hypothetical protein
MLRFSTLHYFKQFRNNISYVAKSYTIIPPPPDPPLAVQLLYRHFEIFFCMQNCHPTVVSLKYRAAVMWSVQLIVRLSRWSKPDLRNNLHKAAHFCFGYPVLKFYNIIPLNAEINHICHLLALLGGAIIVVVSRLRVNRTFSDSLFLAFLVLTLKMFRFSAFGSSLNRF